MGLTTGDTPPVDPATFMKTPYLERIKTLSRFWAEYGFGAPKITAIVYVVKVLVLYICGGVAVASLTSDQPFAGPWASSGWSYSSFQFHQLYGGVCG